MFNVMKAQKYQLLRSNSTYYIFLAGLAMSAFGCMLSMADSGTSDQVKGSTWLLLVCGLLPILLTMLALAFVTVICSGDMEDKTINYEVLTGTRRSDVYFGRTLMSIIMSILCCLVTVILPLLFVTAVNGWGHTMTVSDVALRIAAMIFPIVRLTAFYALIAFLFRNKAALIAFGYILTMLEMLASLLNEILDSQIFIYLFSVNALTVIFRIENLGFGYFDGEDVQVVKDVLEMSTFKTAAVSGLAGTVIFLLLGYLLFRKQDMN